MKGLLTRWLQNTIGRLLGVDNRRVLNTEAGVEIATDDITATMRTIFS